jgi:pilus assembly protein CpaB
MSKLAAVGTAAGLGGMLDENVRAFTVRVDDVSGVAGFIHPGDHVDVLMSLPVPNNRDEQISKVILQDIKVLTAGTIWERGRDNNPVSVNAVTLAVSPDQSEILNLASTQGKIRLVLRSQANKSVKATSGVLTSNLVNSVGRASQALSKESPKAESKPKGKVIEVIKGMKRYASETG